MEEIFANGKSTVYARGEAISIGEEVNYIRSGAVALYSQESSDLKFLFAFRSGEVFPYVKLPVLFSGRKTEYRALGPTTILSIPRKDFESRIFDAGKAKELILDLMRIMEYQIQRIDNLEQGQVFKRLLERLVFFSHRLGEVHGDKIVINAPMSHSDIATSIGTSRETVNRFMRKLQKSGVITVKKQTIVINSLDSLKQMVEGQDRRPQLGKQKFVVMAGISILLLEAYLSFLPEVVGK
jgi:CRP/FNR family transcriptional regulator